MKVWHQPLGTMTQLGQHVITIGNFDGVHKGHMKVIKTILMRSKLLNAPTVVVTFNPHPMSILAPERKPRLLMTLSQRLKAFKCSGIDAVWVIPFDHNVACLEPLDFLSELHNALNPIELHVGHDFKFGKSRDGNMTSLESWGSKVGCKVYSYGLQSYLGESISSTRIRNNLKNGKLEEANSILGHNYVLNGILAFGSHPGKGIDYPMVNFACEQEYLLSDGVYITEVNLPSYSALMLGITNVSKDHASIEVHLPNFQGDLQERYAELSFLHRVRDTEEFISVDLLKLQMEKDVNYAINWRSA